MPARATRSSAGGGRQLVQRQDVALAVTQPGGPDRPEVDDVSLDHALPAGEARGLRIDELDYRDVLGLDQLSPPGMDPMAFGAGNGSMIVLSELPDRTPPA
jgi:hypothetical protein